MTVFACLALLLTFVPLTQHGPVSKAGATTSATPMVTENDPDNPLGYWSFNECSTTNAPDSAGGHDGIIVGAASTTGPDSS